MTKELKSEWMKALRSGEYKQGRKMLRSETDDSGDSRFFSLGVLADVIDSTKWQMSGLYWEWRSRAVSLPAAIIRSSDQKMCMHMNDLQEKSFPEIADWIETNIPVEDTPAV